MRTSAEQKIDAGRPLQQVHAANQHGRQNAQCRCDDQAGDDAVAQHARNRADLALAAQAVPGPSLGAGKERNIKAMTEDEFNKGHIDGAINIPVQIIAKTGPVVPKEQKIEVYCMSGDRAQMAKLILGHKGFTNVHLFNGKGAMY